MSDKKILTILLVVFVMVAGLLLIVFIAPLFVPEEKPEIIGPEEEPEKEDELPQEKVYPTIEIKMENIRQFSDEEEFYQYLDQAMELAEEYYRFGPMDRRIGPDIDFFDSPEIAIGMPLSPEHARSLAEAPERYSETNVQVAGIDEPDIVKTDGRNIYFGGEISYYWRRTENDKTKIVKAFPPAELAVESQIEETGNLLLKNNILVIFSDKGILGYDVSQADNPQKKWQIEFGPDTVLSAARRQEDAIYLITAYSTFYNWPPCLIEPLSINDRRLTVDCLDIYYPGRVVPVDAIYTLIKLDINSGEKEKKISFVGSRSNSIIYMSFDNIYLSYFQSVNMVDFMVGFLKEKGRDIIPANIIQSLERLSQYDISQQAKMVELEIILGGYFDSLERNEQLKIENELFNFLPDYYTENRRQMESTGIVRISLNDLKIKASGNVPGILLNQFALDEYQGKLRVATTIGERFMGMFDMGGPGLPGTESVNDVYVLDEELRQISSIKDLGLGERIYSVRFIQDKGYVVTFREIDPFYVLDLSDPNNPKMKGELKIPGYSSYLHPISQERILGIGKEGSYVKASLFDVSNPYDPQEIDKYFLNEYWSEILSNHHAFLLDSRHQIFFLPAGQGGYVFSFENDKIELVKAISQARVKRAIYIDDYFYVIALEKIIVFDQNNWEVVKELAL